MQARTVTSTATTTRKTEGFRTVGQSLEELDLSVNRDFTTEQGEKREEVFHVDLTLWGKTPEFVPRLLSKGRPFLPRHADQ